VEEIITGDALIKVQGIITVETEKAVLLKLNNGAENWFPKSTIESQYSPEKEILQSISIGAGYHLVVQHFLRYRRKYIQNTLNNEFNIFDYN